jgi:hypothetical protein
MPKRKKSRPRITRRNPRLKDPSVADKFEMTLVWGPYQWKIRETLTAAQDILTQLSTNCDPAFVLWLLREQTLIAVKYADPYQRKVEKSWAGLCHAVQDFLEVLSEPQKELQEDLQQRRAAAEAAGAKVSYWPSVGELNPSPNLVAALAEYSDQLNLLSYKEVVEPKSGGRPTNFRSDAVALALKNHFQETTDSPKWSTISRLLKCAPPITGISMEPQKIRQRLVRWQREERQPKRSKPTLREMAYNLTRTYDKWDKRGSCPSLIHPTEQRLGDTSLSEDSVSAMIEELHKKHKTDKLAER